VLQQGRDILSDNAVDGQLDEGRSLTSKVNANIANNTPFESREFSLVDWVRTHAGVDLVGEDLDDIYDFHDVEVCASPDALNSIKNALCFVHVKRPEHASSSLRCYFLSNANNVPLLRTMSSPCVDGDARVSPCVPVFINVIVEMTQTQILMFRWYLGRNRCSVGGECRHSGA